MTDLTSTPRASCFGAEMARSADSRAAKIASAQHGLITFQQAIASGLTARQIVRRVGSGRWDRPFPGVYRLAGTERSWRQDVLAACFSAGDAAVASHLTAGLLRDLIERRRLPKIEVTVPVEKHPEALGFVVHRTRLPFETTFVGAIPVTSAARTLLDLAGFVPRDELEEALDLAIRHCGLVAPDFLARLEKLSGRRGLGCLRQLVAIRAGRAGQSDGVFATRFARMMRGQGLPEPEIEYEIWRGGQFVAQVDLCYPRERVVIELDGWDKHSSPRALDGDNIRQNAIEDAGYTIRRFTWKDLDRAKYVAGVVRRVLFDRGHPDVVSIAPPNR